MKKILTICLFIVIALVILLEIVWKVDVSSPQVKGILTPTGQSGVLSPANFFSCIKMYDKVNSTTIEYIYVSSGTIVVSSSKPSNC